ncbi:type I methionyl aminopeptidase [Patescibacteria group bacterium]|nr:type I methionyl aminopeptidase [Patescibacteria group bacterium]
MIIESEQELNTLRECGRKLAGVLAEVKQAVRPGTSTKELDRIAEDEIKKAGGEPVFKGYQTRDDRCPFPAVLCVSINDEIVHGIPSEKRILREGEIVGLDIGMRWPVGNGLITDMAVTVPVEKIFDDAKKLLVVTEESLAKGIAILKAGARTGDLGNAIQSYLESYGFGVVRELVGHGVGKKLHEEPFVPNFGRRGAGKKFVEGEVIAIEPMATMSGNYAIRLDADGWTFKTADKSLAAHFEHTVIILKDSAEVLTRVR